LRDFYRFRQRWIHRAEFFRKQRIVWQNDQGLPIVRRTTLPRAR
jgi:hypothetical protein